MTQNHGLGELAEKQMRNWAFQLQVQQRLAEESDSEVQVPQLIHPYLAISREAGINATELAAAIAVKCGWKLLDRELLGFLAEHDHLSRLALDFVDEKAVSWFHEMFGQWLDEQLVSQAEYVSRLGRIVLLAAQYESTLFVGRGAQFMLPRERGLVVRIVAPLSQRINLVMERRQCNERDAQHYIEETEYGRAQFVERYFHRNIADPHLYDLVINLEHLPRDVAIEMIANEAKQHAVRLPAVDTGRASAQRQLRRLDRPVRKVR